MFHRFSFWGNSVFNPFHASLLGLALTPIVIWSLAWKGLALWRAARSRELPWFIAILVLNTVGILEIVYLFLFAKDKLTLNSKKSKKK